MFDYLVLILVLTIFLYGGFYNWSLFFLGVLLDIAVLVGIRSKKKEIRSDYRLAVLVPTVLIFIQIIISFWAIDIIHNMTGIIYYTDLALWMYLCKDLEEEQKKRLLDAVPIWGAVTVLIACLAYPFTGLRQLFWQAGRLGGTFQYSNTYALFLLLGIVIVMHSITGKAGRNKSSVSSRGGTSRRSRQSDDLLPVKLTVPIENMKSWQKTAIIGLLAVGILLTGCRSILILGIIYGIYKSVVSTELRKPVLAGLGVLILISGVSMLIPGATQNVGRLFTVFRYNSTFWGRLLYYIDAIQMILRHPFGLGYSGYYYIQGSEQTGVYSTRFVHNDFLQAGLDSGIVVLVIIIAFVAYQLIRGHQHRDYKEMLAIIVLASLVDWHCQFFTMVMIAVLMLDFGNERESTRSVVTVRRMVTGLLILLLPLTLYIGAAECMGSRGNKEASLALLPDNTEVLEEMMTNASDKDKAVMMANRVLSYNGYSDTAYNTLMYAAAMDGDVAAVIQNGDKLIELRRYDVALYENYVHILESMTADCSDSDRELIELRIDEIPKQLAMLEESTNRLAYKTRDIPVFEIQD